MRSNTASCDHENLILPTQEVAASDLRGILENLGIISARQSAAIRQASCFVVMTPGIRVLPGTRFISVRRSSNVSNYHASIVTIHRLRPVARMIEQR